ncbi:MAG: prepilin-type N-terminal cleavage/methylation domain-containing protein [Patescibacteria group bacterium]
MKNLKSKIKKTVGAKISKGFTLIETLVAITLLVVAITGPLQIAANALFSAFYARDEITAYYLAVEAVEYVKNSRDTLFLSDVFEGGGSASPWLRGLRPCLTDGTDPEFKGCFLRTSVPFNPTLSESITDSNNSESVSVVPCDLDEENGCPYLRYNEDSGFWGYDEIGGTNTKFKRKVSIIPDAAGGDTDAVINVEISWPSQSLLGGDKIYKLTDIMTNWERK